MTEEEKSKKHIADTIKYFDETKYRTAIVKAGQEFSTGNPEEDKLNNLIALITDNANKDFKEETLLTLKKEKAGDLLIDAIKKSKKEDYKSILVAACWESEINFSNHFSFFIDLVMDENYLVSLEAITVVETMEGPFEKEDLTSGIKKLKTYKSKLENEQQVLVNDLIDVLQEKI